MTVPTSPLLPKIECFTLGPFATNSYLIGMNNVWWIIDPSFEPQPLIDRLAALGAAPAAILLTHAHADHISGLADVRRAFPDVPVYLHDAEAEWLEDPELNLSALYGMPMSFAAAEHTLRDNQTLQLGPSEWRVLHVPGHSPGSVAFHHAPSHTLISGDALFAGSIGRTDFPGSDFDTLASSIRRRLYTLPDQTTLYPGHGPPTTIGVEKRTNPYVRA
ncbi:MAG: MBL fold metallo-hydrolase [Tepidisphaera sp.]|nr:MBL fold metallo-hydrolase [Tepidisphaera sp.]